MVTCTTGYMAAKRAGHFQGSREADMFAKSFLTRTIGNYHAGQRPALYQGTLGMVIGLFSDLYAHIGTDNRRYRRKEFQSSW